MTRITGCILLLWAGLVIGMRSTAPRWRRLVLFLPGLVVLTQTVLLLPMLDLRVEQYLNGAVLPHSPLHLIYIASELAKVVLLLALGLWFR